MAALVMWPLLIIVCLPAFGLPCQWKWPATQWPRWCQIGSVAWVAGPLLSSLLLTISQPTQPYLALAAYPIIVFTFWFIITPNNVPHPLVTLFPDNETPNETIMSQTDSWEDQGPGQGHITCQPYNSPYTFHPHCIGIVCAMHALCVGLQPICILALAL